MKMRRMVIWLGGIAAAVIVILVLAALLLPWLIDSRLVKEKIESALVKKTQGTLIRGKIDLLWFTRPSFIIHDIVISSDPNIQGKIRIVKVYPSIIDLLLGRLVVRRVQLQELQARFICLRLRSKRSISRSWKAAYAPLWLISRRSSPDRVSSSPADRR